MSTPSSNSLQAILYAPTSTSQPASLKILNQLALPHQTIYLTIHNAQDAFAAIKNMAVRGAPAIAIVAALSVAVEVQNLEAEAEAADIATSIKLKLQHLLGSRPTAVNLAEAVGKLTDVVDNAVAQGSTGQEVKRAFVKAAEQMLVLDVQDNTAIGERGAEWIHARHDGKGQVRVLTHCNTGSLATAGYGTALGIVRSLHGKGLLAHAYYTETRPYNQGSRLTGYELLHEQIPCTLITDSMAAALMWRFRSEGDGLAAVIVGADRVAANGDTANKIGTYALSVLARFHGVKFIVAAPRTTIDLATASGKEIVIEQRPPDEMLSVRGPQVLENSAAGLQNVDTEKITSISAAALGTQCWNPAFDVTPAELIDAIVTEVSVVEKNEQGKFDLQQLFPTAEIVHDIQSGQKEMPDPKEGP